MTATYHYLQNGQNFGPVTANQLQLLLSSGQLRPEDLVWREGMPAWAPAAQVPGLLPAPPASNDAVPSVTGITGPTKNATDAAPTQAVPKANEQTWPGRLGLPLLFTLVGGGCFMAGLVIGLVVGVAMPRGGGASGSGGSAGIGGAQQPAKLVGQWQFSDANLTFSFELKRDGRFVWEFREDNKRLVQRITGTWKVDSIVEGNYKVQVVHDSEPDRTRGWLISPVDDDSFRIEGLQGAIPYTYTRKK